MKTYLLTWKPKLYDKWLKNIQDSISEIDENGFCEYGWSTGSNKSIQPDDRVFMMKLGKNPGIIADGWVVSKVYKGEHWNSKAKSKSANYVDVHFYTILNPETDKIFSKPLQREGVYRNQKTWTPESSGMRLSDEVAEQLEKDWAKFINQPVPVRKVDYADEISSEKTFHEGTTKQVKVNIYERNAEARAICIKKYGASCSVCGFDFGKRFGEIGAGFIHVHHLKPLSEIRKGYKLNPIEDLRPVCPNCHAMIHQRKPEPYTVEELKVILKRAVM